jgi:multisubunit Na+/H+ antiporter MnhG subunit
MKKEVLEKLAALLTAAFGLVAALAWNDAIKSLFKEGGPLYSLATYGTWFYALFVTILAVAATIYIAKAQEKANTQLEKKEKPKKAKSKKKTKN